MDSPIQTHSPEFQHWGSSLKNTGAYGKKLKCLASRQAEAILPFLNPNPQSHRAGKLVPYLRTMAWGLPEAVRNAGMEGDYGRKIKTTLIA